MLPKQERLTKEDFTGKRPKVFFRSELFDIATISILPVKFACVISKKTQKKAVDRNTVKRRIMNSVRENKNKVQTSIIIYPKKGILEKPYLLITSEIKKAFDTLH